MSEKSVLVILAAGIGSRMHNITKSTNKCIVDLGGVTPLEYTISNFSKNGVKDIIVIVGHYGQSIIDKLQSSEVAKSLNNLIFVMNNEYNHHGCEFSLALSSNHIGEYDTVYITEGDLLLHPQYVKDIISAKSDKSESSVLVRSSDNISETRSVIVVEKDHSNLISRFVYDPEHQNTTRLVAPDETILGESLQLWKFTRYSKVLLQKYLSEYLNKVSVSEIPCLESGLYSINRVLEDRPMLPVKVTGTNWLNLNTEEDINKGRNLEWIK